MAAIAAAPARRVVCDRKPVTCSRTDSSMPAIEAIARPAAILELPSSPAPWTKPQHISTMPARMISSVRGKGAHSGGGRSSSDGRPGRGRGVAARAGAALAWRARARRAASRSARVVPAAGRASVALKRALAAPLSHSVHGFRWGSTPLAKGQPEEIRTRHQFMR